MGVKGTTPAICSLLGCSTAPDAERTLGQTRPARKKNTGTSRTAPQQCLTQCARVAEHVLGSALTVRWASTAVAADETRRGRPMDAAAPPVAQLLRQEAAAWESLLQLHTALSATQKQALAPPSEPEGGGHASPHSRAYLSSLTHLAACGDALVAEALKLRSLRSARDSLETAMYRHVVVHHQEQFFKRGEATSRAVTGDVLQNTADLRSEVSRARTELTQLRAALEALDGAAVRLPAAASRCRVALRGRRKRRGRRRRRRRELESVGRRPRRRRRAAAARATASDSCAVAADRRGVFAPLRRPQRRHRGHRRGPRRRAAADAAARRVGRPQPLS